MFDKTIEKIVLKHLPGIESRLQAALSKKVDESFGKLLLAFEDRVGLIQSGITVLNVRFDALPAAEKILTSENLAFDTLLEEAGVVTADNFGDNLDNTDVLTKDNFDIGDYNVLTSDDFSPSDFDLVTNDEIDEKVTEALDDDDIREKIADTFIEKLSEALKKS